LIIALLIVAAPQVDQIRVTPKKQDHAIQLSPAEMFEVAENAKRSNDLATAETIYRALATNPTLQVRNEARFRLARMLEDEKRLTESAVLLRNILDEQPDAQPVRLELAKVLVAMGDDSAARRELRAARAGQLPPEVARQVDRFSEALRARKPMGGSIEVAVASDSNVNRATRSDTLGTVIGDFTLDKDARAQSGEGLAIEGQSYGRIAISRDSNLLGTISGAANLYRKSRFNDVSVGAALGPEVTLGDYQLHASAGASRRWFGQKPFTDAGTLELDIARLLSATAQIRGAAAGSRIWNHLNPLESGHSYSAQLAFEKAFSTSTGGGFTLTGIRQALRDPGYSTTSGQASIFGWHEAGRLTYTGSLTYGRLVADERLLLYLDRRNETLYRATVGATARQIQFRGFAPTVSFTWERNRSPIEIYDYGRTVLNVGVTRAF
jgi:outer membrane protein